MTDTLKLITILSVTISVLLIIDPDIRKNASKLKLKRHFSKTFADEEINRALGNMILDSEILIKNIDKLKDWQLSGLQDVERNIDEINKNIKDTLDTRLKRLWWMK